MTALAFSPLTLDVPGQGQVSALLGRPRDARAAYVLAHGAGAGMEQSFMRAVAEGLGRRGIATLRFQFPSRERGSPRPDSPSVAHAAVRAAVAAAGSAWPDLPLFAGGKSFGGRMSSQAQAIDALPGVAGLVFFGFPLHPAGKPADERGVHLSDVRCPMLFLQGTRDDLAERALIEALAARLGPRAGLVMLEDADHSFHVRASSGQNDAQVLAFALDTMAAWIDGVLASNAAR